MIRCRTLSLKVPNQAEIAPIGTAILAGAGCERSDPSVVRLQKVPVD